MAFDTTRLLNQVNLKGALATGRFEDQEILDLASDALISLVAPMIVSSREEYYLMDESQTVTANQAAYPIPYRALGMALRELKVLRGTQVIDLYRMDPEDVIDATTGTPEGFYLKGNNVVLYPTPDNTGDTLQLTYFVRPSSLVPTTSCAVITGITGNTLTCVPPSSWTTASSFDLVQGKSGFSLKALDLSASAVNAGDIVLTSAPPSTLAVGDYVALAGESCFPHLPAEAHQLLVHLTVAACLEAIGDTEGMAKADATAKRLQDNFSLLMTNRVQGAPRRFNSRIF
jgi:hypothetical protein